MTSNASVKGFFTNLYNSAKNVTKKASNVVLGSTNNTKRNTSKNTAVVFNKPVTAGVNISTVQTPQKGGVAPNSYSVPPNQRQPSEAIMNWATTAGIPKPSHMNNVAHGGRRRRFLRKSSRKNRSRRFPRKSARKNRSRHH